MKNRIWSESEDLLLLRSAGSEIIPDDKKNEISFQLVNELNINDCGNFEDISVYLPIYQQFVNNGDELLYGYLDGKCGFRMHLQKKGVIRLSGHSIRLLGPNIFYMDYAYCAPEFRGHGIHSKAIRNFCSRYPNNDIYAIVAENNTISLHNYQKNGFSAVARLSCKNRFLFRFLKETPI